MQSHLQSGISRQARYTMTAARRIAAAMNIYEAKKRREI